jgi:DnaJ family protein A protein 2
MVQHNGIVDQRKVIKRKGMPFYKDPISKGNLIIVFEINFPAKEELEERDFKKLADILEQPLNPEATIFLPESNFLEELPKSEEHKEGEGDWEDD